MNAVVVGTPLEKVRTLEGRFDTPPSPRGLQPTRATQDLVKTQVRALLESTPSFHEMPEHDRKRLEDRMSYIASYAAECMREMCWHSKKLGQTPVLKERETITGPSQPIATAQENPFKPRAASQIARITQETLKAIAFPTFVADLIRGTFDAIVKTSIQQMESFLQLLNNVSKTVDQFMNDNISDDQAKDWLAQTYPRHIQIKDGQATVRDGADEVPAPNFQHDLRLNSGISLDDSSIEEKLVPAARRRLAESRLQILSTLVLMGVNRIVVTAGKIRATMGFHIDTTDRGREETASDFDLRHQMAGSFGWGPWSASASTSIAYVTSTRKSSDAEINTETDLTAEVELRFKSDYFPLERFAGSGMIGTIQSHTAVPSANQPNVSTGQDVIPESAPMPVRQRKPKAPPPPSQMRPIGAPLPPVRPPDPVQAPVVPPKKEEKEAEKPAEQETTQEPAPEKAAEPDKAAKPDEAAKADKAAKPEKGAKTGKPDAAKGAKKETAPQEPPHENSGGQDSEQPVAESHAHRPRVFA